MSWCGASREPLVPGKRKKGADAADEEGSTGLQGIAESGEFSDGSIGDLAIGKKYTGVRLTGDTGGFWPDRDPYGRLNAV